MFSHYKCKQNWFGFDIAKSVPTYVVYIYEPNLWVILCASELVLYWHNIVPSSKTYMYPFRSLTIGFTSDLTTVWKAKSAFFATLQFTCHSYGDNRFSLQKQEVTSGKTCRFPYFSAELVWPWKTENVQYSHEQL